MTVPHSAQEAYKKNLLNAARVSNRLYKVASITTDELGSIVYASSASTPSSEYLAIKEINRLAIRSLFIMESCNTHVTPEAAVRELEGDIKLFQNYCETIKNRLCKLLGIRYIEEINELIYEQSISSNIVPSNIIHQKVVRLAQKLAKINFQYIKPHPSSMYVFYARELVAMATKNSITPPITGVSSSSGNTQHNLAIASGDVPLSFSNESTEHPKILGASSPVVDSSSNLPSSNTSLIFSNLVKRNREPTPKAALSIDMDAPQSTEEYDNAIRKVKARQKI